MGPRRRDEWNADAAVPSRTRMLTLRAVVVLLLLLLLLLQCARPADNAQILAVETVGGKSHWNFMSAVLRSLTDAGHVVTAFTPFPDGDRENYTEVNTADRCPASVGFDLMETLGYHDSFAMANVMTKYNRLFCDTAYDDRQLSEMLAERRRFDVVLVEPLQAFNCMSFLAVALDAPLVYVIPCPTMLADAESAFTGHVPNPACVAHLIAHHAVPGTFAQRLLNTALSVYSLLRTGHDERALRAADPRPYDRTPAVTPAIIFQNGHYVAESSRPVPPNIIHLGGIHLRPAKTIPKDILDFIEDSPHGVIYFTFGSTIKLSSFPKRIEKAFKEALANVSQKVLWKYEAEMNDMPKNVMIKKWFPQRDILLHPKIKLFISHGGISGVYEAVDAGVPVLGFPLIFDQPRNIEHLVRAGMAISMDILTVTEDVLLNVISELINNEKYMKNAKKTSYSFNDRPMSPEKLVVYWTEYVIHHKGAPHLKSHALNLIWYQYFSLDVLGFILICLCLIVFISYTFVKVIYCYTLKYSNINKIKTKSHKSLERRFKRKHC